MQEEQQGSGRITLSMPASRRAEFDAALMKLKQRKPFDSISKIVAEAVISAAATIDASPEGMKVDDSGNYAPGLMLAA